MIYSIIRKHFKGKDKFIKTVNTLEEAQEHCQKEDTHGAGWFDAYIEGDYTPKTTEYNGNKVNIRQLRKIPNNKSLSGALCSIYHNPLNESIYEN